MPDVRGSKLVAPLLAAALVGTAAASQQAAPYWWTPALAATALQHAENTITWARVYGSATLTGAEPEYSPWGGTAYTQVQSAACHGFGASHKGAYAAFTCQVTAANSASQTSHTETVWVRMWTPTSVCASDRALADCAPAPPTKPLPGDPRVCTFNGGTPAGCLAYAATNALRKVTKAGLGCVATADFTYHCTMANGSMTVTFVQGTTAWTTRVTTS